MGAGDELGLGIGAQFRPMGACWSGISTAAISEAVITVAITINDLDITLATTINDLVIAFVGVKQKCAPAGWIGYALHGRLRPFLNWPEVRGDQSVAGINSRIQYSSPLLTPGKSGVLACVRQRCRVDI